MTRRLFSLLAPLAACVAMCGFATSAHAARHMELALGDDQVFVKGNFDPFKGLDAAQKLHTTYIRANLPWTSALGSKQTKAKKQPKNPVYNWTPWDDLVKRARLQGMAVQLTLVGPAPRWATSNHKSGFPVTKPNASKFGAFARAAALHFQGDVSVTRFTIWNEPNLVQWLAPSSRAPKLYRALYADAYNAIKKVNPNDQVLIGETAPYGEGHRHKVRVIPPLKFLRGVTCVNNSYKHRRCKGLKTDGYAHHPYDYKHKPTYKYPGRDNVTVGTLSRLTSALSKLRKARALTTPKGGTPYVYLTEYGYFASYKYKLSQKKQASYLVQGFKIAQKNKHVKEMLQYVLVPPPSRLKFFSTQIMTRSFKPLKAYNALKKWADSQAKHGGIATQP